MIFSAWINPIKPFQCSNKLIRNLEKKPIFVDKIGLLQKKVRNLYNFSSDNQTAHRRQVGERRDHENTFLFNYDGTTYHPHTKYGTSALL